MATDKKTSTFFNIGDGTKAQYELQLDGDLYSSAIRAIVGGVLNIGTTVIAVPSTIKTALKSGEVVLLKCKVSKGTGDTETTRRIRLLCEKAKVAAATGSSNGGLAGKTINLGSKANSTAWKIETARA